MATGLSVALKVVIVLPSVVSIPVTLVVAVSVMNDVILMFVVGVHVHMLDLLVVMAVMVLISVEYNK